MTLPFFCGEETLPIGFLTQSLVSTQAGSTEKQIMKPLMLMLFTLCLTGCVQYKWVKPDASEQQETITETACRAQALRDLPPDNVVSGKYTSKDSKYKTTDTDYSTSDANDNQREILVKDCMFKKGWQQIEIQQ